MTSVDERETLTVPEVANLLGISPNSVYAAAGRGEIPHRRVGRRLIFSRRAISRWLEEAGREME